MGMFRLLPKIYETCIKANSAVNIPTLQLHFPMPFLGIFVKTFLDFIFLPIRLGMLHFILHEDIVLHWKQYCVSFLLTNLDILDLLYIKIFKVSTKKMQLIEKSLSYN